MSIEKDLVAVIEKYRMHPQFIGMDITDVNQRGVMDDTMLHFAAVLGATEDIDVLVASGVDVNAVGDIGNTPLLNAAMRGKAAAVKKLLELGADPELKNELGWSAAEVAKNLGRDEVVEVLRTFQVRRAP
jgi:ankyrin repeat protein